MTLATNGILQGFALLYSQGTPSGFSSPMLRWFMTGRLAGVTPVAAIHARLRCRRGVGARAHALRTPRLRHRQRRPRRAALRHSRRAHADFLVYMLSSLCAAVVGVMLTGFSGQGQPRHGRRLPVAIHRSGGCSAAR
ncbi:hypothetical protein ACVOMV_34815 [Mesorhizobium atlanticum]